MPEIRKARKADIPAVAAIYERIHDADERGEMTACWQRGVYPTAETARDALERGSLYVMEDKGRIVAAAKIDSEQVPEYAAAAWEHDAPPERVLVLHTLVTDPLCAGRGYGSAFVAFYEALARETARPFLRMDTNVKNTAARRLYAGLGYREAGVVSCCFNGIPGVELVCLEKALE